MLVDDEIIISMSTKSQLEKYGYKVLLASSAEQVMDLLKQGDDTILILPDIDLGNGINGIQLAANILQ